MKSFKKYRNCQNLKANGRIVGLKYWDQNYLFIIINSSNLFIHYSRWNCESLYKLHINAFNTVNISVSFILPILLWILPLKVHAFDFELPSAIELRQTTRIDRIVAFVLYWHRTLRYYAFHENGFCFFARQQKLRVSCDKEFHCFWGQNIEWGDANAGWNLANF